MRSMLKLLRPAAATGAAMLAIGTFIILVTVAVSAKDRQRDREHQKMISEFVGRPIKFPELKTRYFGEPYSPHEGNYSVISVIELLNGTVVAERTGSAHSLPSVRNGFQRDLLLVENVPKEYVCRYCIFKIE